MLPYSAAQLTSYEVLKELIRGNDEKLTMEKRLVAGALAGMVSTLATYPLDTLRLRMAVDPSARQVVSVGRRIHPLASCQPGSAALPHNRTIPGTLATIWREGGLRSVYRGAGTALAGIAPYMAIELALVDSWPQQVPGFMRGFAAALVATSICYPLDTIRRQMQLSAGSSFASVFGSILGSDGFGGLYRGFIPNAIKNLPNKSVRYGVFGAAKEALAASDIAYKRVLCSCPFPSIPLERLECSCCRDEVAKRAAPSGKRAGRQVAAAH